MLFIKLGFRGADGFYFPSIRAEKIVTRNNISAETHINDTNNPHSLPISYFGIVETPANEPEKIVVIPGFTRQVGTVITLKFEETPTEISGVRLNGAGLSDVQFGGISINKENKNLHLLRGGGAYLFVWDGSAWQLINPAQPAGLFNAGRGFRVSERMVFDG